MATWQPVTSSVRDTSLASTELTEPESLQQAMCSAVRHRPQHFLLSSTCPDFTFMLFSQLLGALEFVILGLHIENIVLFKKKSAAWRQYPEAGGLKSKYAHRHIFDLHALASSLTLPATYEDSAVSHERQTEWRAYLY